MLSPVPHGRPIEGTREELTGRKRVPEKREPLSVTADWSAAKDRRDRRLNDSAARTSNPRRLDPQSLAHLSAIASAAAAPILGVALGPEGPSCGEGGPDVGCLICIATGPACGCVRGW